MKQNRFYDDINPTETEEWLLALDALLKHTDKERAQYILEKLSERARAAGVNLSNLNTPYLNTIPTHKEPPFPGDAFLERRIRSLVRWNALAMVMRANDNEDELGGHISTFASAATLYDIGFNHFFKAPTEQSSGDLIYFQGHSSPGIYARAFLEGRLSEEQLDGFRRETQKKGLSSYPHPWLMPDFWQFPTVSMGLAAIQAINQAHFMKYLENRKLIQSEGRKVWTFLGDGEMDEPESLGAISLAGREKLDNLIFVINCNLQRLDGPVRGNGKIIQELESVFRGAGWNVIKVIWGRLWDPLIEQDEQGVLRKRMEEMVDGEYQACKMHGGAYTRAHFFNHYPELAKMVEGLTDQDIYNLNRGGHDPYKVYAAYHQAVHHAGQPTVILAKTVKGYGMGLSEAQNKTHQIKKLDIASLKEFRDRFDMPFTDEELEKVPYYRPSEKSNEMRYLKEKRQALGGFVPQRHSKIAPLNLPDLSVFAPFFEGSQERKLSTTMGFVRMLNALIKLPGLGERIVPIVPDEARTFGMEGMFKQLGIYSSVGQLYEPEDAGQAMFYREDKEGRILEAGINEAGAMSAWMAAATSYSSNKLPMIPFYIYYSMFGFQRVGDLIWAAGDMQARGFLIGATSGRTTLNGEGLQHQDGHSHLLASTIPNCVSYDPCFNHELAVIIHTGLKRMFEAHDNVFYYITTMNENYTHPPMPPTELQAQIPGIIKGMTLFKESELDSSLKIQLLGSGAIFREVIAAAELLADVYGVAADIWSVTSFSELRREGLIIQRWNMLHPQETKQVPYITECFKGRHSPVIAVSDYMKIVSDQIRPFVRNHFTALGTDGFGRSDSREKLRNHFEVDRFYIVLAALNALADKGLVGRSKVQDAIKRFEINPEKIDPQWA